MTSIRSALSLFVISDLGLWSHTVACKINESDHFSGLASPSFLSCYCTWAGATLKIDILLHFLHFFFFCPIRERSWRPIFVSLQTRKWLLFSPLQQEHLSGRNKPWELARGLGHGAEERLDFEDQHLDSGEWKWEKRGDIRPACAVSAGIYFPSSLICTCTGAHAPAHLQPSYRWLPSLQCHVTSTLLPPSIISPLQFHWFPATHNTTLRLHKPSAPTSNLLLTLSLIWGV